MSSLLVVTEGGAAVGLGHIRRCLSLAAALRDAGIESRFAVAGGEALIRDAGFAVEAIEDVHDVRGASGDTLIDSYRANEELFRSLGGKVIAIDDLADRDLPVDMVINSAIRAEQFDYARITSAALLLGPRYALLRREFAQSLNRVIKPDIERVLVTLGGGDQSTLLRDVVAQLEDVNVEVVVGPFASSIVLEGVELLRDPNMREAMLRADLAISAGGQTLFELAATGTPAIVIETAANQRHNIAGFAEAGTIRVAPGGAELPMAELRDATVRAEMSGRGRDVVDGQGAARTAAAIATLLRATEGATSR